MDRVVARTVDLLVGASFALSGCATTGLGWVHEHESGVDLSAPDPESRPGAGAAPMQVASSPADLERRDPPRPRLDHTITLGGEGATADLRAPAAQPAGAQPIVNVYVMSSPYAPPYASGYGYGGVAFGAPFFARAGSMRTVQTVPVQTAPALRPGLDWPAVPNRGPAFPYRTGPASPWSGENPRRSP